MSSFAVKNILRKDIVTHHVFFNNSCDMADYLASKNPQYYYSTIPVESLVMTRQMDNNPIEILSCMKQHLIVFRPKKEIFCKEYLCDCATCLQFDFENCSNESTGNDDNAFSDEQFFDEEVDQTEQVFDFVTVPSFISLFSGSSIEPLYFVKVTGKSVATEDLSDPYGHFVSKGERYFQGLYLKLVRSRDVNVKKFVTLPTTIVVTPDEIYDTYVDFNGNLELDCDVYNMLIRKASC